MAGNGFEDIFETADLAITKPGNTANRGAFDPVHHRLVLPIVLGNVGILEVAL